MAHSRTSTAATRSAAASSRASTSATRSAAACSIAAAFSLRARAALYMTSAISARSAASSWYAAAVALAAAAAKAAFRAFDFFTLRRSTGALVRPEVLPSRAVSTPSRGQRSHYHATSCGHKSFRCEDATQSWPGAHGGLGQGLASPGCMGGDASTTRWPAVALCGPGQEHEQVPAREAADERQASDSRPACPPDVDARQHGQEEEPRDVGDSTVSVERADSGFWRPGPHLVIETSYRYSEGLDLSQYAIIAGASITTYRVWDRPYSVAQLRLLLRRHGFTIDDVWSDLAGTPRRRSSPTLGVVARRLTRRAPRAA